MTALPADRAPAAPGPTGPAPVRPGRSPAADLWRRFAANPLAIAGGMIILALALVAVFAPALSPASPIAQDYSAILQSPSARHPLGTDPIGRDILARILYGTRVSMSAGFISVGLALAVGLPVGMLSGFYRGWWDEAVIMRLTDAVLAFPSLILALALNAALGQGLTNAMIAIGFVLAPTFVRLVRAQVLAAREQDYVQAARALGQSDLRIMFGHILPNILAPILVQSSLGMATAIVTEASLSYLGLGVVPPTPSWGSMLREGVTVLSVNPMQSIFSGAAIFIGVLAFNLFGDGIRDALDPRLKN